LKQHRCPQWSKPRNAAVLLNRNPISIFGELPADLIPACIGDVEAHFRSRLPEGQNTWGYSKQRRRPIDKGQAAVIKISNRQTGDAGWFLDTPVALIAIAMPLIGRFVLDLLCLWWLAKPLILDYLAKGALVSWLPAACIVPCQVGSLDFQNS
jgi:hypothetical protein